LNTCGVMLGIAYLWYMDLLPSTREKKGTT
jgi:hypothetical protein